HVATPHTTPLPLHDALPISKDLDPARLVVPVRAEIIAARHPDERVVLPPTTTQNRDFVRALAQPTRRRQRRHVRRRRVERRVPRSEEHTSELQSPYDIVFAL